MFEFLFSQGIGMAFRTVDGRNARSIADSMGLDREQMNYLLELPNRRAVVHYAGWPRPFVIEVPAPSFVGRRSVRRWARWRALH